MRISDWSSDVCSSDLVETALASQNVEIPAGRIESRDREFSVVSSTDLQTPAQFAAIVVANVKGYPVRLGDVAKVEIGAADDRILSRFNGRPARSEEHTSELQSLMRISYAVFCLKKQTTISERDKQ